MADTRITNLDFAGVDSWVNHPGDIVYTSTLVGYFFSQGASGVGDLRVWKTTNGGTSWSEIASHTGIQALNIWYDKWTPGIATNLIHVTYVDRAFPNQGTAFYRAFDPASDTFLGADWTAIRDLQANGEYVADDFGAHHSLCRARNGHLYWVYDEAPSPGYKGVLCKSTDNGVSWVKLTGWPVPQDQFNNDDARLILAPSLSFGNIVMYFATFDAPTLRKFEWNFQVVDLGWSAGQNVHNYSASGALRACACAMRSDFESFLVAADETVGGGATVIKCYQIGAGGIIPRADVVSGAAGTIGLPSITIDSSQGHLYVGYLKGTNVGTTGGACKPYWKRSLNGGFSWGPEQLYSSAADADYRDLIMPRRSVNGGTGRAQIAFMKKLTGNDDYIVNTAADPPTFGQYTVRPTLDGGAAQILVNCQTGQAQGEQFI